MINLWILPYPIFTQTRFGQLKPFPEQNGRPIRSWLLGGLNHPENVGHIVGNPESIPKMWGFTQWPSRRWQASSHNFWALALGFSHEFNQGTDTNNSHDHDLENCLNSFELISGVATSELVGFVISFSEKHIATKLQKSRVPVQRCYLWKSWARTLVQRVFIQSYPLPTEGV